MNTIPEPEKWEEMIPKLKAKESELEYKENLSLERHYIRPITEVIAPTADTIPKVLINDALDLKEYVTCATKKQIDFCMDEKNKGKRPGGWKPSKKSKYDFGINNYC
jgi:hypothetical protein